MKQSQLFDALRAHWLQAALIALVMVAQALLTLAQPWPIRSLVDQGVGNTAHVHNLAAQQGLFEFIISSIAKFQSPEFAFLYQGLALLLLIYTANALLLYFQNIALAKLGQQIVLRIRKGLFSQIISLPVSFFEHAQTGDLTSRISKDTAEVQDLMESLMTVCVRSFPTVIGILVVSFALDWVYALTFFFVIPLIYYANLVFSHRTKKAIAEQRCIEGDMAATVQETLYYHKAVATLSLEDDKLDEFVQSGMKSLHCGISAGRFQGILTASTDFLIGLASLLVLMVGILRIMHGCLTVGQLMVFLSYLNSLFKPVREISKFAERIAKSSASLERVEEIARLEPMELGAAELPIAKEAPQFKGDIALQGVTFGYRRGQPVLQGVSLSAQAGRKVAIVGDSGSGKSTVLQLLVRLYDPERGSVKIDGTSICNFRVASLRSQIAVVLQDSYIFRMSIADNIAVAKAGAARAEVVEAAKAAGAHEFIEALPKGYDTLLGEGGAGLSGGQKRRLALARAFLRDAPILLLDEPTVGLDAVSESKVSEAIKRLSRGRTTVIVTHQLSTIADADLIYVLSAGKVVEAGTHRELLDRKGLYRRLWEKQQYAGKPAARQSEAV